MSGDDVSGVEAGGAATQPRRGRGKPSLKMQAIGFLSRREHSRQELRTKLVAALRRRAREEAAQVASEAAAAAASAAALASHPSNGIDDAFAPPVAASTARGPGASRARASARQAIAETLSEDERLERSDPEAAVERLLDWLAAHGYLSDERFVESRVNARARKQGATRIRHELARHGLALAPEQAASLRETEFARAQAIWQRKFGQVGADARERAKQARFLASRGFASDVVRRLVGGEDEFA